MRNDAFRLEIRLLLLAGFGACLAYPLGVFAPLPITVRTLLLAFFGPLLGLGSFGLFRLLTVERSSTAATIAVASNAIAGSFFTAMMLVQLAAGYRSEGLYAQSVWLGLDVAWDIYIAVGTVFFAAVMYGHRSYGRTFSISGLLIAFILLSLNLATFPVPPANAGLFDAGPLVGGWYAAVTIASWIAVSRQDAPSSLKPGLQVNGFLTRS